IEHITNSDFPLGGRGPHHGHDADDTGDEGGSDDGDTDTTEDGGNAAAQGDTVTVAKLFLPLVTR
ncbi:MAG: hypothetical protein KDE19_21655, partial [Caldilineaceae bacterium]|nr:hypothetical protein [Caldilineaceae bacterium]